MKRLRLLGAATLLVLGLSACRPDTVDLGYRYPTDGSITYRMQAHATADWNIGGEGGGEYDVTFEVTETVGQSDGNSATVSVVMEPLEVEERGLPSPGSKERSFALEIGPNGEVLEVLEVDGVAAEALDPDELAFIGTYRPPLPPGPVTLRDTWRAEREVALGTVFQQIVSEGELEGLRRDADGKIAQLHYQGEGPLVWTTTLPQGEAELTGEATTSSTADLDIDGGFLRAARSSTEGTFDVRVDPGGQRAPIVGTLELDLDLTLEKL